MKNSLGLKVRKIREIKDYSQQYVADKLSMSQSSYSDLENGKVDISEKKLIEIAKILNVEPHVIEHFSEQIIFNSCSNSGYCSTYNINNPLDKIEKLHEEIAIQYNERIKAQEAVIKAKEELIEYLKKVK